MNIFIMLAIVLANVIAITLVYQFIKKLLNKDKIIFIVASVAIIYIVVSIAYWISGIGIDNKINDTAKDFITYVFVPVNVIILVPFVAVKYNKWKLEEIEKGEFLKRLVIVSIIGVIILVGECFYFKNMKNNINSIIEENLQQKNNLNGTTNTINEITTNVTNETNTNTTNEEIQKREEYNNTLRTITNTISETIENNIAINEQQY